MPLTRLIRCLGLLGAAMGTAGAQTFTVLHTFDSSNYEVGPLPVGNLAIDANGVLYGATQVGEGENRPPYRNRSHRGRRHRGCALRSR